MRIPFGPLWPSCFFHVSAGIVLVLALLSLPVNTNIGPVFSLNRLGRSSLRKIPRISCVEYPDALNAPMIEPMLVPTMPIIGTPFSSSTSITPKCAKPFVPPPESTSTTPASPVKGLNTNIHAAINAHSIFFINVSSFRILLLYKNGSGPFRPEPSIFL